jgi:hypothetical protein
MKAEFIERALDLVASEMKADEGWDGYDHDMHRACANSYLRAWKRGDLDLDEDHLALLAAHSLSALALRIEAADARSAAAFADDWLPQPAADSETAPAK